MLDVKGSPIWFVFLMKAKGWLCWIAVLGCLDVTVSWMIYWPNGEEDPIRYDYKIPSLFSGMML